MIGYIVLRLSFGYFKIFFGQQLDTWRYMDGHTVKFLQRAVIHTVNNNIRQQLGRKRHKRLINPGTAANIQVSVKILKFPNVDYNTVAFRIGCFVFTICA